MKDKDIEENQWLLSKDVQKELKIRACDLMHLREDGKINFKKKGNAFLYSREETIRLKKENS